MCDLHKRKHGYENEAIDRKRVHAPWRKNQGRGDMYEESVKFLAWAEAYDDPDLETGRSRVRHEQWLKELKVPVIRLSGEEDALVVVKKALIRLGRGE